MDLTDRELHAMWSDPAVVKPAGVLTCTSCGTNVYFPLHHDQQTNIHFANGKVICPCGNEHLVYPQDLEFKRELEST